VRRLVGTPPASDDLARQLDVGLRSVDAEARHRDATVSSHASAWLVEHDGAIEQLGRRIDAVAERQRAVEGWARVGLTAAREQEARLARATSEIWEMIDARPFTSDNQALRVRDPLGRETIGYAHAAADGRASYLSFEDLFRGSEDLVREMQRPYLDFLRGAAPVLDLGCGRGEMLDLLRDEGIDAVGVDLDSDMIRRAAGGGHDVLRADALEYLGRQEDGGLGAVFLAQFIEHLSPGTVRDLVATAARKLRPGGLLIAETVNPHSLRALKTFWLDLAHVQPLYPEALVWLCRELDYDDAFVFFPGGSGRLAEDLRYVGQYAVVARTPGGERSRCP